MSRADSHEVGGEGNEVASSGAAGGEDTSASHENGGGDLLVRLSLSVMVSLVDG